MDEYVEEYITIRDKLMIQLESMMEVYMTGMWDPMMRFIIVKELQQLIVKELSSEYPDFPVSMLPSIKFKVNDEEHFIEVGVQAFLNKINDMIFLGSIDHAGGTYDLYCRKSWDPNFTHVFYARYGHEDDSFIKGSKEPAAQYLIGQVTPLSIAYSFAVEEGYIT